MRNVIITNAKVVTPFEVKTFGSVVIEQGKIVEISDSSITHDPYYNVIDAHGNYLIPGIIDLHTDAIEVEICPRPAADFPIEVAFRELEKRMCGVGITTVFHSMFLGSIEYKKEFMSKYPRIDVFEKIYKACHKSTLINNKIHLRYEVTGMEEYNLCFELIERGYISFFSFMDHTPTEELLTGERFEKYCRRKRLSQEQAIQEIKERMQAPKITKQQKQELISFLKTRNIPIASHDDHTGEIVEENHSLGIDIAEFPISKEASRKATELKMHSIGGAANVLRGGSNIGNMNIQEAVTEGIIDVLCSDYYPPSLLYSIFILSQKGIISLPKAVNLVSLNAARAANIDSYTGSIKIGKDADLLLVDCSNPLPKIAKTIVGGNISGEYSVKQTATYEYND